jgi:hypothetical protein
LETDLNTLTIQDLYAMFALAGMLASGNLPKTMPDADLAECSFNLANAMIEQRNKNAT